jgi:hypothetical protein
VVKHAHRKTYIDEICQFEKKNHIPAVNAYQQIIITTDRKKLKPNLNKAENCSYLDGCMRNAAESPGAGAYNTSHRTFDHRLGKWVADPEKKKSKEKGHETLPFVGSYNPNPVAYQLFSSMSVKSKIRNNIGLGGKSQRFQPIPKEKSVPFYDIGSEWGMKDKLRKKDILYHVSTGRTSSQSVYY